MYYPIRITQPGYKWKFIYLDSGLIYYTGWVTPKKASQYFNTLNIITATRKKK